MKVQNDKTSVPSGVDLNDKDYMNLLLSNLKCMVKNYAVMLTEASNEKMLKRVAKIYQEVLQMQRQTYLVMFQNGWYSLDSLDETKIKQKQDMLTKEYDDLSNN